MTTLDIKALTEQVERDLRDKPIWRLLYTGIALLGLGLLVNMALGEADPEVTERWDGPAAVCAAIGGIFIASAWVVRILQRGRREEITQEVTRALAPIEVERARRDMRLMDMVDGVNGMLGGLADCVTELSERHKDLERDLAAMRLRQNQLDQEATAEVTRMRPRQRDDR